MISQQTLHEQLKKINFNPNGWGKAEANELANILSPDEVVEEAVNGYYDAGFALLAATKNRLILVDKKPLNYLTVEEMRFDMISEFDYSHRLFGAHLCISSGVKTFNFRSYNQTRLRSLVTFVQHHMSNTKNSQNEHLETQRRNLEAMNEQLKQYLEIAHKQQFIARANAIAAGQPQAANPQTSPAAMVYGIAPEEQPELNLPAPAQELQETKQLVAPDLPPQTSHPDTANGHLAQIKQAVPRYSHQAWQQASQLGQFVLTPQQVGLAAARRVVPVISAYSRLPLMSNRRRYYSQNRAAGAA